MGRPASDEASDEIQQAIAAHPDPFPALTAAGVTFIARAEVSGPREYRRRYKNPVWPSAQSGITIGIGYDLRFVHRLAFESDWGGRIPDSAIERLARALGTRGSEELLASVRTIDIPLPVAMSVFLERTLPEFVADTRGAYPQFGTLSPACRTALVSLVYNRGPLLIDRDPLRQERREMRAIRDLSCSGGSHIRSGTVRIDGATVDASRADSTAPRRGTTVAFRIRIAAACLRLADNKRTMAIEAVNPATGETLKTYDEMTPQQTAAAVADAHAAWKTWRKTPFAERARPMKKAAAILRERKDEFAKLMALEMGKPFKQGVAEAEKCALGCEYYADHAEAHLAPEMVKTEAAKSYVAFEPLGVVLAVMPWNFPFWQVFRFAAPALMAGNAGVLKHASNVPGCALAIEEVFVQAGFPKGVFRTLLIGSRQVKAVIEHPHVSAVTLTGSTPAGKAVAAQAGASLKKTVLELGGSDPYIVLEDADLELRRQHVRHVAA